MLIQMRVRCDQCEKEIACGDKVYRLGITEAILNCVSIMWVEDPVVYRNDQLFCSYRCIGSWIRKEAKFYD